MSNNDLPNDDLLQFIFGELEAARQPAMQKALAEDAELAALARGLETAVSAVRAAHVGQIGPQFNDRLRRQLLDDFASVPADTSRPTSITRSLVSWRRIMRHPVARVAAAVIFVFALGGVVLWFHGNGATPALADFLAPILDARTMKFKVTAEGDQESAGTGEVMIIAPNRVRKDWEGSRHKRVSIISDGNKSLWLIPAHKLASITTRTNAPKEDPETVLLLELRSLLRDARDRPDWIREPLREKEIDGRRLVGYRLTGHGLIIDLWGDPKTGMPVRMESTSPVSLSSKSTIFSDFVFDPVLDESLFSLEPPAGYSVEHETVDASPAEEKDLLELFRLYTQLSGGSLPDKLEGKAMFELFFDNWDKYWKKSHPVKGEPSSLEPSEAELQQQLDRQPTRGLSFAFEQLPREADAHYAGAGVKLGAADAPIFWYRPKNAQKYRVIYGDLSVREADVPPNVPNAQPLVSASGPKK